MSDKEVEVVVGTAGSGKTRMLVEELTSIKRRHNFAAEQIAMITFTRMGRLEFATRLAAEWGCTVETLTRGDGNIRTAHSIAMRQCGIEHDDVLGDGRPAERWIEENVGSSSATAIALWDVARNRGCSLRDAHRRELWLTGDAPDYLLARKAVERYERAKRLHNKHDYHDLLGKFAGVAFDLDEGHRRVTAAGLPPEIGVLAVDEAQDSSPLVDLACRRLSEANTVKRVILCGDPFQAVHAFAGGDYRLFLGWTENRRTMPRSWRCPPAIYEYGERCLRRMKDGYFDRGVAAAEHDGDVRVARDIDSALRQSVGESRLLLARCQYTVAQYAETLDGLQHPYAYVDRIGADKSHAAFECLWRLQNGRPVRGDALRAAIDKLAAKAKDIKFLDHGAKKSWRDDGGYGDLTAADVIAPTDEYLRRAGCTDSLIQVIRDGRWPWAVVKEARERARRWVSVASRHGLEEASKPSTRLSTIHGAKGAEADTVIVSARSTRTIARGMTLDDEIHDEECRVAYVAATRAKRRLIIVEDYDSPAHMPFPSRSSLHESAKAV